MFRSYSFNKNIISIDLGAFETKIISGKENREEIVVSKAFSYLTPTGTYENGHIKDMGKLLNSTREELTKNQINKGICHLTVKSTAVITREIPFPVLGEEELEGLLRYQLAEYLPMDYSKYIIQHKVIGKIMESENEKLNVLVVAIPRDIVDMHHVFINELGLKAAVMDYQSNGIWKLLNFTDYINEDVAPAYKTIAAIDLGYNSTNIAIVKKGVIQTSRVIDLGGEHLDYKSNNEKISIEGIMDRIDKVFRYYLSKESNNEIDTIMLCGGLSQTHDIDKLFNNYFNIPAFVLDKVGRVSIKEDANKYINCIGAILRDDEV